MLCGRCRTRTPGAPAARGRAGAAHRASTEWERFEPVICAGCGLILPAQDAGETIMETLSRLARFGLGASERPLLRPNGPES